MAVTLEQLMVEVRADVRQALAGMSALEARQTTLMGSAAKLSRSLGFAFGGAAVVGGITKTLGLAMSFDKTIRTVGVQTGTTGKQLAGLGDLAKQMGQDTIFSAQDAGDAMLELAKGGLTAAQIKAGALNTTMTLAAAGSLELGDAATYVSQGMHTFHLAADQANRVTTALAGGANASAADVSDLGQALSQVGPGARNAGFSIEQTVAALAAFSNAGINGSDAGTSLKTMLTRLVPSTKRAREEMKNLGLSFIDSKGNIDSLDTIAQKLKDHLGPLSQAQRTQALNTIFGSDATRAASVLMDEGRKGIQKYEKATKDQTKAQDMANVTMGGASGAWENFKGTAETTAIAIGQKALPKLTELLNWGTDLLNDAPQWGSSVQESFGGIVSAGESLFHVAKDLGGVVGSLAGFFDDLPGPVKQVGAEAAIAALLLPRLTGAVNQVTGSVKANIASFQQWRAEMSYTETRAGATTTAMGKLTQATKTAAGIGGMVALTAATQTTNDGMKILLDTLGGAATGFAMGGAPGALIGGAGGGLLGITSAAHGASAELKAIHDAADDARAGQLDLRDALDQTTGAMTKQARQVVSQDLYTQGLNGSIGRLGLSTRDVVSAILGQEGALKRVNAAVERYATVGGAQATDRQNALSDASVNLGAYLSGAIPKFREAGKEIRAVATGSETWKKALKGLPKDVRVQVRDIGTEPAKKRLADLAGLVKREGLGNKQIRLILKALGVNDVDAGLKKVRDAVKATGDDAAKGGKKVKDNLENPLKSVSPNLRAYVQGVKGGVGTAKTEALSGGVQVGSNLKSGVITGFSGTLEQLSAMAAAAVHAAVAAAKAAGKIKSPSRRMRDEVGKPLGEGVAVGLRESADATAKAGKDHVDKAAKAMRERVKQAVQKLRDQGQSLAQSLGEAVRSGGHDQEKAFAGVEKWARKWMAGKDLRQFLAKLRKDNKALQELYTQRAKIETDLANAQANLSTLQDEKSTFVDSARAGMASQAQVVGMGSSASTIKAGLQQRLAHVREFAGLLKRLKAMGYSNDIIKEVAGAGVEQGLASARALAAASAEDQAAIQSAYSEINQIAKDTSAELGASMFDAGISAAQSVVDGLTAQQKSIQDQINAIGQALVATIKHDLKQGGKQATQNMADAIKQGQGSVWQAARDLAAGVKRAVEDELKLTDTGGGGNSGGGGGGGGKGGGKGGHHGSRFTNAKASAMLDTGTQGQVSFQFVSYNPVAEPQSRTQNKALEKAATLGLIR